MEGKVKWFNERLGYGFIIGDDKEYFVHFSDIEKEGFKTLHDGQSVEFSPGEGDKGATATGVKVIDKL